MKNAPNDGDWVEVGPGDYGSLASPITDSLWSLNVDRIYPRPFTPRPRVFVGGSAGLLIYNGGHMSDITVISAPGATVPAIGLVGASAARMIALSESSPGCSVSGAGPLSNSVCATNASIGPALTIFQSGALVSIRGVTAWSNGANGQGVTADAGFDGETKVNISGSILHGNAVDVTGTHDLTAGAKVTFTLDHSNYAKAVGAGARVTFTAPGSGTNQTSPPLLTAPASFDFRPVIGSPTIDAGPAFPADEQADAAGAPRSQGAAPDIGAFEFAPQASTISSTKVAPSRFRAARSGATIAAKKKAPVGAKVSIALNMTSSVAFTVEKSSAGRKSAKGNCVAPTRKNRKRKACTRYIAAGKALSLVLPTGTSTRSVTGRVSSKKLKPGRYRLKAVPTAFGAPAGVPAYAKFTIVK